MAKEKNDKVKITLIKSLIGRTDAHRATVRGLGLKKLNHTVELDNSPEVKWMINAVNYLLIVEN